MKRIHNVYFLLVFLFAGFNAEAQFSKENSGEIIFSFSEVEKNALELPTRMRFTLFFHVGQNYHYDLSNKFGLYTGYGIRNIGIVTEENNNKFKRRTYALGLPLAFKVGSFRDHSYFYAGGEYELFFHYKQKLYVDGNKSRQSDWFSGRTERFAPSLFAGFQFPGGVNLKFKYYPNDFLNRKFKGVDFGDIVDYSEFNKTQLFYIALSFNFKSTDLKKLYNPDGQSGRIATL